MKESVIAYATWKQYANHSDKPYSELGSVAKQIVKDSHKELSGTQLFEMLPFIDLIDPEFDLTQFFSAATLAFLTKERELRRQFQKTYYQAACAIGSLPEHEAQLITIQYLCELENYRISCNKLIKQFEPETHIIFNEDVEMPLRILAIQSHFHEQDRQNLTWDHYNLPDWGVAYQGQVLAGFSSVIQYLSDGRLNQEHQHSLETTLANKLCTPDDFKNMIAILNNFSDAEIKMELLTSFMQIISQKIVAAGTNEKEIFRHREVLIMLEAYFPHEARKLINELPNPAHKLLRDESILRDRLQDSFYIFSCAIGSNKNTEIKKYFQEYKAVFDKYKRLYGFRDAELRDKIHDLAIKSRFHDNQSTLLANILNSPLVTTLWHDDSYASAFSLVENTFTVYQPESRPSFNDHNPSARSEQEITTETISPVKTNHFNLKNFKPIQSTQVNISQVQTLPLAAPLKKFVIAGGIILGTALLGAGILFALPGVPVLALIGVVAGALFGGSMAKVAGKLNFVSQKSQVSQNAIGASEKTPVKANQTPPELSRPVSLSITAAPRAQTHAPRLSPETPSPDKDAQFTATKRNHSVSNAKPRDLLPFFNQSLKNTDDRPTPTPISAN